jgi:hypothetical protein
MVPCPTHTCSTRAWDQTFWKYLWVVYFQNFHALSQSVDPTFLYSSSILLILVFRIVAAKDDYLTHGTSVGAGFTSATHVSITYLPLYNTLFSTLDLFAMTIHVASFSLKGSSYCNHCHPCHQVKLTCPT